MVRSLMIKKKTNLFVASFNTEKNYFEMEENETITYMRTEVLAKCVCVGECVYT